MAACRMGTPHDDRAVGILTADKTSQVKTCMTVVRPLGYPEDIRLEGRQLPPDVGVAPTGEVDQRRIVTGLPQAGLQRTESAGQEADIRVPAVRQTGHVGKNYSHRPHTKKAGPRWPGFMKVRSLICQRQSFRFEETPSMSLLKTSLSR